MWHEQPLCTLAMAYYSLAMRRTSSQASQALLIPLYQLLDRSPTRTKVTRVSKTTCLG